jgi:hypothetical protein
LSYINNLQLVIVNLYYNLLIKALDKEATLEFNIFKLINLTLSKKKLSIKAILKQLYTYIRGLKTR